MKERAWQKGGDGRVVPLWGDARGVADNVRKGCH